MERQVQKVYVHVKMNVDDITDFKIIPNVISHGINSNDTNYTNLVTRLESDAAINRSFYSRVKSDLLFCNILSGVDKDKRIS